VSKSGEKPKNVLSIDMDVVLKKPLTPAPPTFGRTFDFEFVENENSQKVSEKHVEVPMFNQKIIEANAEL
jgi:hypothetical protein